jgi:hypothetical protein
MRVAAKKQQVHDATPDFLAPLLALTNFDRAAK